MERNKMIPLFVLDASVIVKWFSKYKEKDLEQALEILEKYKSGRLQAIVPDLLIYELANALRYNPQFDNKDVKKSIKALIDLGITIIIFEDKTVQKAIDVSFQHNITVYDAVYYALALKYRCKLITANPKCFQKIKSKDIIYLTNFHL